MAERLLPNSRGCFVCGRDNEIGLKLRFTATDDGVYTMTTPGHQYQGFDGFLQGGVAAGVLDDAMWYAIFAATSAVTMTAELTVRYKAPVPIGEPIRVEGRLVERRRTLFSVAGRILSADGKVLMESSGKFLPAPQAVVDQLQRDTRTAMEENE